MTSTKLAIIAVSGLFGGTLAYLYVNSGKNITEQTTKYKNVKSITYGFIGGASMVGLYKYIMENTRKTK